MTRIKKIYCAIISDQRPKEESTCIDCVIGFVYLNNSIKACILNTFIKALYLRELCYVTSLERMACDWLKLFESREDNLLSLYQIRIRISALWAL